MDSFTDDLPPGAISAENFALADAPHASNDLPPGAIPEDQFQSQEDAYGDIGHQIGAGALGIAEGLAGPVGTGAAKLLSGASDETLRGIKEANPITHGAGVAAGLVGPVVATLGASAAARAGVAGATELAGALGTASKFTQAGVMTGVGEGAMELAGLANLAAEAPLIHRVGAAAVSQAAEMAVLSSGDEVSKMILNDPESSAESAIANVGMAAALGGAGGAFITGAVSPLWNATAGPGLERTLNGFRDHLNGTAAVLPEETNLALSKLGIQPEAPLRAAMSGNASAIEKFNVLKEVQNKEILAGITKLETDAAESVMKSLGTTAEDVAVHSENEAGRDLLTAFKKEYDVKYGPLEEQAAARKIIADPIAVTDEAKLAKYGSMLENGMNKVGTDSPYFKLYEDYGNRMLAKDNIGQLDKLRTEINNRIKGLKIGGDYNEIEALSDIRKMIGDFQEAQIAKEFAKADLKTIGADVLNQRADFNRNYSEFAKLSDELQSHLGVGRFKGAGALEGKLTDAISPEDLLKKFSFKGNADFIPFLKQNFPETFKEIQANELKRFLKPAILSAKGEAPISVKKMHDLVSKGMSGQKEYIESILSAEALEKIAAANKVMGAIPSVKSSGTAGWMTKTMKNVPASAMAAIAALTGRNPILGALLGETSSFLGRTVPDAVNLSYLRFLGSDQPVKAEGFKAMVDFIHNTYKGENMINKSVQSVFKAGAQTITSSAMPAKADREKLDKIVTEMTDTPDKVYKLQNGHVGHYLSAHQAGLTEVSTRALGYLQSIKPQPFKASPLDHEIAPGKAEMARYDRALDIAQNPSIIMKHIKDGTLQDSDMKDLGSMYPGLYKNMAQKLSNEMTDAVARKEHIPYKTRMSMSLFLGQPLDSTMAPMSIQAAQATYLPKPESGMNQPKMGKGAPSKMGKNTKSYQTPLQASESRKMNHK